MNNICRAKRYGTDAWIIGYYAECVYYLDDEVCGVIIPTTTILYPRHELDELILVDHTTVCRYTGLKDKNGIRIFEYDYVRTEFGRICEVVWFSSPQHCGWDLIPVANLSCSAPSKNSLWASEWLIVLGNKFDNIELMEVSNEYILD